MGSQDLASRSAEASTKEGGLLGAGVGEIKLSRASFYNQEPVPSQHRVYLISPFIGALVVGVSPSCRKLGGLAEGLDSHMVATQDSRLGESDRSQIKIKVASTSRNHEQQRLSRYFGCREGLGDET